MGVTIIEAVRALHEGKCNRIKSLYSGRIYWKNDSDLGLTKLEFTKEEIIHTFHLLDFVITPEPGEVWEGDKKSSCWIYKDDDDNLRRIFTDGTGRVINENTIQMIHNQNGWRRVFPPVEGE